MKLILTHEVTNVGEPGDVVEVKDGYGRNYLLPRGFAIRWTRGAGKQVESIQKARAARAVHDREDAVSIKQRLEQGPINVPAQVGSTGRLFGSITVTDVADALEGAGAKVDKRRIEIGQPIKSLGAHTVTVRIHPEVSADVRLNVVSA